MSTLWVVAYDISDHKVRREVSRQLEGCGLRTQYSVFECRLTSTQLQALRSRLSGLIEDTDQIRWYPLCNWCESTVSWQGDGKEIESDEFFIV